MAHIQLIDTPRGTGLVALAARSARALRHWNDERITRKALRKLSARELADIGLTISDVESFKLEAFAYRR